MSNSNLVPDTPIDETLHFQRVSAIIENRKHQAAAYVNREVTLMFWEIGQHINAVLLGGERAIYGKSLISSLAEQLREQYGSSLDYTNMRRMLQFAARFLDFEIVAPLAQQLSWFHITELLPLKSDEAFL